MGWTQGNFQMARSWKRKKVLGQFQRVVVANVQGFHPLFHESDLAPLFHPLSALSLKETTLWGENGVWKCLENVQIMPLGMKSNWEKANLHESQKNLQESSH